MIHELCILIAVNFSLGKYNKMGVFALKNVGFVVWIFFCKFVDYV